MTGRAPRTGMTLLELLACLLILGIVLALTPLIARMAPAKDGEATVVRACRRQAVRERRTVTIWADGFVVCQPDGQLETVEGDWLEALNPR